MAHLLRRGVEGAPVTPSTFTRELRRAATDALADGPVRIEDVVASTIAEHGALFRAEGQHLAEKAAARVVKDVLRKLGEDDDQDSLTLPGVPLPSVIYVEPVEGDPYYRRTDLATWTEVVHGQAERARNVDRARKRLKAYENGMDRLRPLMAADPTLTVGEALRRTQAKAA